MLAFQALLSYLLSLASACPLTAHHLKVNFLKWLLHMNLGIFYSTDGHRGLVTFTHTLPTWGEAKEQTQKYSKEN